ncbi:MAG: ASCH domain-containing protein [Lachnospiraceae bacterium]|nr:ASCH domain-containing protein [Lachnospiraceae bacterium]
MTIKPILFNTEMVQAILEGRKTVTRRVIKFPINRFTQDIPIADDVAIAQLRADKANFHQNPFFGFDVKLPYSVGDILYIRETWSEWTGGYVYKAWSESFPQPGKMSIMNWHPSLHMPKEAARIWLKVKGVHVERLQDITDEQAEKEGCNDYTSTALGFSYLWDSTIKRTEIDRYGWDANPWVWVIEFEQCEKPEE